MNILVVGHSYVVDSNRQFWNQLAQNKDVNVDIIVPKNWNSNLIKKLEFNYNPKTDNNFTNIFSMACYFKGNASLFFFNWIKMYQVLLGEKYDLIFVFQETWSLSVAQMGVLKLLSRNRNTLYYLAVCQNIIKKRHSWLIPWERLITKNVDRILYCTKEIIDVLDWKKINVPKSFFPFTYDQSIYDFKIKKIKDKILIGYMGRLTEEKGIFCLIEACRKLISDGHAVKLFLAGDGPLRNIIQENFIEYVGPFKHTEAHLFYHRINVFVLPSETRSFWKEQFGRVIVESIASGTPVVGSNSGAIPEVLSKLQLNYIFNEGSSEDLAEVIRTLLKDINESNFYDKIHQANELNLKYFSHLNAGLNFLALARGDLMKKI